MAKTIQYRGFWRRLGAYIIDSFICIVLTLLIGTFLFLKDVIIGKDLSTLASINLLTDKFGVLTSAYLSTVDRYASFFLPLFMGFYLTRAWSSSHQATIGMKVLGLKIVSYDNKPISRRRAVGRFFAMIITSVFTLGIGFLMVAFTKRKQGLHDMIAKTYVIRT